MKWAGWKGESGLGRIRLTLQLFNIHIVVNSVFDFRFRLVEVSRSLAPHPSPIPHLVLFEVMARVAVVGTDLTKAIINGYLACFTPIVLLLNVLLTNKR